jgi:predicted DNA-binding protein
VTPSSDHQPSAPRSHARVNARLNQVTRQKVDDLARRFHQPRASVLAYIMQWGLSREPMHEIDQGASHSPARYLNCSVASDLYEHVQRVASAAGIKTAPWLRQMVGQIAITDFPTSWQEATPRERFHESRAYGKRFMMRLDAPTWEKLEDLSTHFGTSAAEIIRQLVAQAEPEDFPQAWQSAGRSRRSHPRREASTRRRQS